LILPSRIVQDREVNFAPLNSLSLDFCGATILAAGWWNDLGPTGQVSVIVAIITAGGTITAALIQSRSTPGGASPGRRPLRKSSAIILGLLILAACAVVFFLRPSPPPPTWYSLLDWDGKPWRVQIQAENFIIAPKDTPETTQTVQSLRYLSWNRDPWEAIIHDGQFVHMPRGNWSGQHPDSILNYVDWDGVRRTMPIHEKR